MKSHWLPVDSKHTEVLGYPRATTGKKLWATLDWNNWWIDGPAPHMFNPGGSYFHVNVIEENGKHDGRSYRVRCIYAGGKYRGDKVVGIDVGVKNGNLHWLVRTATVGEES